MRTQIITAVISLIVIVAITEIDGQLGDPSLRCPRCPIGCPSPQGYPLSCRNACKSYNTRFTEVQCSAGRCNCKDPANYPSSTRPTTTSTPGTNTNVVRASKG